MAWVILHAYTVQHQHIHRSPEYVLLIDRLYVLKHSLSTLAARYSHLASFRILLQTRHWFLKPPPWFCCAVKVLYSTTQSSYQTRPLLRISRGRTCATTFSKAPQVNTVCRPNWEPLRGSSESILPCFCF